MQNGEYPRDIDPSARPSQFDDVLGRCGELELMLGRLRREHLLPDEECARCQREVRRIREQLTTRRMSWEPGRATRRCPHCHTSGIVEYVDGLDSRYSQWKCVGCGRLTPDEAAGQTADEGHTQELIGENAHRGIGTTSRR